MGFLTNFIRFPAVQTFWKSVKIWQSYREFKGGKFFSETQCRPRKWTWNRICWWSFHLSSPSSCRAKSGVEF